MHQRIQHPNFEQLYTNYPHLTLEDVDRIIRMPLPKRTDKIKQVGKGYGYDFRYKGRRYARFAFATEQEAAVHRLDTLEWAFHQEQAQRISDQNRAAKRMYMKPNPAR